MCAPRSCVPFTLLLVSQSSPANKEKWESKKHNSLPSCFSEGSRTYRWGVQEHIPVAFPFQNGAVGGCDGETTPKGRPLQASDGPAYPLREPVP